MKATQVLSVPLAVWFVCMVPHQTPAGTTVFFDPSQIATLVSTNPTSDTISCEGYVFEYTRDKLFTGGVGLTEPIGRSVRIPWPDGIEAQYVTTITNKAEIIVRREDGAVFDLTSFTAHLLANAGAGRAIEIVPLLNGTKPLDDPLYFDVSGNYGSEFSYDTSPNYLGTTVALVNYDGYVIKLSLDYALTALTLESTVPNVNHAPTDMALSSADVLENEPPGTWVGTLDTTDGDVGDTFTYGLVTGAGDSDNALFSISGSDLLAEASFNYEVKTNYSVRVESVDQGLLSIQKAFTITVSDVVEPPPFIHELALAPDGSAVIRWSSMPNHVYTVHHATNLVSGFSVLESNVLATPIINSYTDSVFGVQHKFWKITTEP